MNTIEFFKKRIYCFKFCTYSGSAELNKDFNTAAPDNAE